MLYLYFVYITFAVKIAFIISILTLKYYEMVKPSETKQISKLTTVKEQIDFVYVVFMSIILLLNFGPWVKFISIDYEKRILFFIYGIIVLLTANYDSFKNQSILLHENFY